MRVNVYAEELREVQDKYGERVTVEPTQAKGVDTFRHFGLRLLLGDRVVHSENDYGTIDDDTPAVTFWFASAYDKKLLLEMLQEAVRKVEGTEVDTAL